MKNLLQKLSTVTFVILFLAVVPLQAQSDGRFAGQIQAIEAYVQKQMASDKTPGVSLAFMKDDFVWAKGFGFSDLENKVPATEKSAYRLASVTKPMTATAIMQLVEKGKIDLDADVQTYVPYFPRKPWPVTVRQLMGHLGGISHYKNDETELHIKEHKTTREAIAIFQDFDLVAEPVTQYNYSSYGYNLLGAVIEGASGMSFGDYMRQHVWGPAGMNDTRLDDPYDLIAHRVRGYELVNGEIRNSEFVDISSRFAAGGTRSTVEDMMRFAHGLNTGKLLSPGSIAMMYEPMVMKNGRLTDYGMGWGTGSSLGRFTVRHSGGQQETRTMLYNYPAENFIVAVACNFESANPSAYANAIVAAILNEPVAIEIYTPDKISEAILLGMRETFASGLNYFERFRQPQTVDQKELAQAFAYFNQNANRQTLQKDYDGTMQKIRDGRHPIAPQAFIKIGSFMAMQLQKRLGDAKLDEYHKTGAIPFFYDYIETYKKDAGIAKVLRFNTTFEKLVQGWHRDWQRTWTPEIRAIAMNPKSDFAATGAKLQTLFAGAQVYPSFVDDFDESIQAFALRGDQQNSLRVGEIGVALYPASDALLAKYGIALLFFGENEKGRAQIKKASIINSKGAAGPGELNDMAYQLAGLGQVDKGMELLQIAVELYPKEANLYDSIGEFHLKKGEREQAIAYYKKALEVDPNFENAKNMLKKIMEADD